MLDQNLLNNLLYYTLVLPLMIEQNDMIHDFEVEVHREITITKITTHKTDIALPLKIVSVMANT